MHEVILYTKLLKENSSTQKVYPPTQNHSLNKWQWKITLPGKETDRKNTDECHSLRHSMSNLLVILTHILLKQWTAPSKCQIDSAATIADERNIFVFIKFKAEEFSLEL